MALCVDYIYAHIYDIIDISLDMFSNDIKVEGELCGERKLCKGKEKLMGALKVMLHAFSNV